MSKTTRLIILLTCIISFLVISPILVAYSMGYRFDFEKMKVVATGGIFVRTFPSADKITIDSEISQKPGFLANSVFVQSLLPKNHTVLVVKEGYYDYSKTLPVKEKEVTKIENVLLFKKNIQFTEVLDKTQSPFDKIEKYIIKNGNLYYSNSPENSSLSAVQKSTPLIKKITSFSLQNNSILWLGQDGILYKSELSNLLVAPLKITLTPLKINKTGVYKIVNDDKNIFVIANKQLLILNTKTSELDVFSNSVNDAKISPDGKNIIYYDDNSVYLSEILVAPAIANILYKSSDKISDCLWLNNDYIIFVAGNQIIISEIDYRGNINTVTLPQTATSKIFFDHQTSKLYIQTGKTLLLSEKLIP